LNKKIDHLFFSVFFQLLSDEQPLYPRGKTLHIRPISRPYLGNYRCSVPGSSYADANSVLTFGIYSIGKKKRENKS